MSAFSTWAFGDSRDSLKVEKLEYALTPDVSETQARLKTRAALYAFTSDGVVLYIGKTALSLEQRFAGYRLPGSTQSTNKKCHNEIRKLLSAGKKVQILALGGLTPLRWGEFELNIAAGLEDSLISELLPPWNGGKLRTISESETLEREALNVAPIENSLPIAPGGADERAASVSPPRRATGTFTIKLRETYYTQGIINPGKEVSSLLGQHDEPILIRLGRDDPKGILVTINRRANPNGSPRLYGSRAVSLWFRAHFKRDDLVTAKITTPNEIVLELPTQQTLGG